MGCIGNVSGVDVGNISARSGSLRVSSAASQPTHAHYMRLDRHVEIPYCERHATAIYARVEHARDAIVGGYMLIVHIKTPIDGPVEASTIFYRDNKRFDVTYTGYKWVESCQEISDRSFIECKTILDSFDANDSFRHVKSLNVDTIDTLAHFAGRADAELVEICAL